MNYDIQIKSCKRFGYEFYYIRAIDSDGNLVAHTTAYSEEGAKNNLNTIIYKQMMRKEKEARQKAAEEAGNKKKTIRTIDYRLL